MTNVEIELLETIERMAQQHTVALMETYIDGMTDGSRIQLHILTKGDLKIADKNSTGEIKRAVNEQLRPLIQGIAATIYELKQERNELILRRAKHD